MKPNADHYPFFEHGIPVLMFHTGLHDEYHRPGDVAKLINSAGMTRVTRLLFGMLYEMAERPAAVPGFRAAARYESPETESAVLGQTAKPADRLGVVWTEDAAADRRGSGVGRDGRFAGRACRLAGGRSHRPVRRPRHPQRR